MSKEIDKLEILTEVCKENDVSFSGVESNAIIAAMDKWHEVVKKNDLLPDVSGSAFDIEELHTLHSGLITAKPHLNKRTKGYMMVVAMIEKLSYLIREHYR